VRQQTLYDLRKRREQLIAKAERALEQAKRQHDTKVQEIEKDRASLDKRSHAENARWERHREKWRQLCVERVTRLVLGLS
jgi:hypothetical protein